MENKNIKQIISHISAYIVIFIIMLLIFFISMIATYALPNDRIQVHIKESRDVLLRHNGSPLLGKYVKGGILDDFTDLLILNTSMNKGKKENENILVRAFENSRFSNERANQYTSLERTMDDPNLYNNEEYSRYWHGIQTIVRPLLLFLNYEEIRYLFMIIMFILLAVATMYIFKNLNIIHGITFVFSMMAVCFFIVPASIQYTGVFAITLISVILVNVLYEKKKQNLYPYLFFIIGGCTTFFDLLTVPALTLGIPLIYVVLLENKEEVNIKRIIIEIIKISSLWCIAYIAVFFSKWVIASIILKRDAITVAIKQLLFRTNGSKDFPTTKLGAIKENVNYLYNTVLFTFLFIATIICIVRLIKNRKKIDNVKSVIPLLIISLYPYIWYTTFTGHSTEHAFFTFRLQAITILGIFSAMIECVNIKNK